MFKVIPFVGYDLNENETFFQTRKSSVVITDKSIIDFLKEIEKNELLIIDKNLIEQFFENRDTKNILNFLEQNKLIEKNIDKFIDFNNIILYTNDSNGSVKNYV